MEDFSGLTRMLDNLKESTLRSKDYYKFVIGLSTGALIFSVTFVEKFSLAPVYKPIIVIGWICLIISIITGVWLLPKRDSLEVQWKGFMDLMANTENILFGLEQDSDKLMTRFVINYFLNREMSKEPKDEEKIKELRKDWIAPNGRVGIAFVKRLLSELEKSYPALTASKPDFSREYEKWKQVLTKQGKSMYLPNVLKRFRETYQRVSLVDKVMTASFFASIILITLFSAINFLEIDVIDLMRQILSSIILNSYAEPLTGGGITGMDSTLRLFSIFGTVSDIVVASVAIIAAIVAYRAWRVSKGQLKSQIISDILREYRSVEMGSAIRRLHEEFEQCEKIESKLVDSYNSKYESEKTCRESLHNQRRMVSNFYQHVSTLISNGVIENTVFYSMWTKKDLKIIQDILLPIERKALPYLTHRAEIPIENLPRPLKNMLEFYEKAPES